MKNFFHDIKNSSSANPSQMNARSSCKVIHEGRTSVTPPAFLCGRLFVCHARPQPQVCLWMSFCFRIQIISIILSSSLFTYEVHPQLAFSFSFSLNPVQKKKAKNICLRLRGGSIKQHRHTPIHSRYCGTSAYWSFS